MLAILYLFVYQVLRTFNMLTKPKISEARCSDVENIVTMLSNEVAIHKLTILYLRVSDTSCLQHAYEIKDFGSTMFRCRRHRNHVEHRRCETFVFPNFKEICKHVEHRRCDTFRVSDTLCLQHAYEIKDFGSTIPSSKDL